MQQVLLLRETLALTSTRLPNGIVTAEVARNQTDGTWLWEILAYASRFATAS